MPVPNLSRRRSSQYVPAICHLHHVTNRDSSCSQSRSSPPPPAPALPATTFQESVPTNVACPFVQTARGRCGFRDNLHLPCSGHRTAISTVLGPCQVQGLRPHLVSLQCPSSSPLLRSRSNALWLELMNSLVQALRLALSSKPFVTLRAASVRLATVENVIKCRAARSHCQTWIVSKVENVNELSCCPRSLSFWPPFKI